MGIQIDNPNTTEVSKRFDLINRTTQTRDIVTLYVTPTGVPNGDGSTLASATTLENIRQKYSNMTNINLKIILSEGEHVINDTFNINNSYIEITGDETTWDTNPTVICSTGAVSSKIATDYANSFTCAAHTEANPYILFLVSNTGYLDISNVVCNNNHINISSTGNIISYIYIHGLFRFNMWYNPNGDLSLLSFSRCDVKVDTSELTNTNDTGLYIYTDSSSTINGIDLMTVSVYSTLYVLGLGNLRGQIYRNSNTVYSNMFNCYKNSTALYNNDFTITVLGITTVLHQSGIGGLRINNDVTVIQEYNPTTPIDGQCRIIRLFDFYNINIMPFGKIVFGSDLYITHSIFYAISCYTHFDIHANNKTVYIDGSGITYPSLIHTNNCKGKTTIYSTINIVHETLGNYSAVFSSLETDYVINISTLNVTYNQTDGVYIFVGENSSIFIQVNTAYTITRPPGAFTKVDVDTYPPNNVVTIRDVPNDTVYRYESIV